MQRKDKDKHIDKYTNANTSVSEQSHISTFI